MSEIFLRRCMSVITNCTNIIQSGSTTSETINYVQTRLEVVERSLQRSSNSLIPEDVATDLLTAVKETLIFIREAKSQNSAGSSSAYTTPIRTGRSGRPKYIITEQQVQFLLDCGFSAPKIADLFRVSLSTVKRRLREYSIRIKESYSDMSDVDLDNRILSIIRGNSLIGPNSVRARLQGEGFKVQRYRVRESMIRIDPAGAAERAIAQPFTRRTYSVAAPNSLWHVDGNHKLIRWRIVIHGGIDGYSRMFTFLKASDNNRAETVLDNFSAAVWNYGLPSRVRCDYGGENNDVCYTMEVMRGGGRGSSIRGASVHNQRIERSWVDVWCGVTNLYYDLFSFLEAEGLFNVDNECHIWALHYIFIPRLNRDLEIFTHQWNTHGLRTESHKSPMQLYVEGILAVQNTNLTAIRDIFMNDDYEQMAMPGNMDLEGLVEIPVTTRPISEENFQQLVETIDPLDDENDMFGLTLFSSTLQVLNGFIVQ